MTTGYLHARADSERHLSFVYCQWSEAHDEVLVCVLTLAPGARRWLDGAAQQRGREAATAIPAR